MSRLHTAEQLGRSWVDGRDKSTEIQQHTVHVLVSDSRPRFHPDSLTHVQMQVSNTRYDTQHTKHTYTHAHPLETLIAEMVIVTAAATTDKDSSDASSRFLI